MKTTQSTDRWVTPPQIQSAYPHIQYSRQPDSEGYLWRRVLMGDTTYYSSIAAHRIQVWEPWANIPATDGFGPLPAPTLPVRL